MKRFYGEDLHLNFLRGCVNDGACPLWDSCWARNMARRLAGRAGYPRDDPFKPHCPQRCPEVMMSALHRLRDARRPKVIAFNYMGDVALHEAKNVKAMADFCDLDECRRHTFLWLTKRPALLREFVERPSHGLDQRLESVLLERRDGEDGDLLARGHAAHARRRARG